MSYATGAVSREGGYGLSVRVGVRSVGEILITVGTVIVLFVVYLLYWTGVKADEAMPTEVSDLQQRWAEPPGPARRGRPPRRPHRRQLGRGGAAFAILHIPRLGGDDDPVLQGTALDLPARRRPLRGHGPARPVGNFAVAGHRSTYGEPFRYFPELRPGDLVVLRDDTTWYTYRDDRDPYTVPGDIGVLDPVPAESPFRSPGRYLTLTTCDPEWGSSHRLIAWGHLDSTQPVTRGEPPALDG